MDSAATASKQTPYYLTPVDRGGGFTEFQYNSKAYDPAYATPAPAPQAPSMFAGIQNMPNPNQATQYAQPNVAPRLPMPMQQAPQQQSLPPQLLQSIMQGLFQRQQQQPMQQQQMPSFGSGGNPGGLYGSMNPTIPPSLRPPMRQLPDPMRTYTPMPQMQTAQMPSPYPANAAAGWQQAYNQQAPFLQAMNGAYQSGTLGNWNPNLARSMAPSPATPPANQGSLTNNGMPNPNTDPWGYITWLQQQNQGVIT